MDAAQALEEIEPEDETRNEVFYARVDIYLAAKKWDMAAAVARHLVKADPGNPAAWINLAYAPRSDASGLYPFSFQVQSAPSAVACPNFWLPRPGPSFVSRLSVAA